MILLAACMHNVRFRPESPKLPRTGGVKTILRWQSISNLFAALLCSIVQALTSCYRVVNTEMIQCRTIWLVAVTNHVQVQTWVYLSLANFRGCSVFVFGITLLLFLITHTYSYWLSTLLHCSFFLLCITSPNQHTGIHIRHIRYHYCTSNGVSTHNTHCMVIFGFFIFLYKYGICASLLRWWPKVEMFWVEYFLVQFASTNAT